MHNEIPRISFSYSYFQLFFLEIIKMHDYVTVGPLLCVNFLFYVGSEHKGKVIQIGRYKWPFRG